MAAPAQKPTPLQPEGAAPISLSDSIVGPILANPSDSLAGAKPMSRSDRPLPALHGPGNRLRSTGAAVPGLAPPDVIVTSAATAPRPEVLQSSAPAAESADVSHLFHRVSLLAGGILLAIGGLALVGWLALRQMPLHYRLMLGLLLACCGSAVLCVGVLWWDVRRLFQVDAQRRTTEQALRDAEAVYHSLVETLPQRIFRKDLQGRFTFGNGNFCRARGRALQEIVGKTDYDFSPPELAKRYRSDDKRVVQTGQTLDIIEEYVNANGSQRYIHTIKTPVFGREGQIVGVQGIHWDITDRKLAEKELERKNQQLEEIANSESMAHMALKRAHEALKRTQSHLVQSEKLAGLGQMVAGVAHEINNPLAFISNNVAVLQRDEKPLVELLNLYHRADELIAQHQPELASEIRDLQERVDLPYTLTNMDELLARSRDGLKRIQQIVKDLRNFARLDEADLHETDLNVGIESTINIIQGMAKNKQVQLIKELGELPPVWCYPAKINQVVMNLISNALDASDTGQKITVRTTAVESEGERARPMIKIEVLDEGSGIDPVIRDRIFDPFFTTKPPGQGTGLGLSISYGIIQDHGGTIDVQSAPGQGSTFTVLLPVQQPRQASKQS